MTLLFVSGLRNSLISSHTTLIRAHLDLTDHITYYTPDRFNLSSFKAQTKEMSTVITDLQYADDCDVLAHTAE